MAVNLTHYEFAMNYGLRDQMQLSLRVPYDIKAMRVHYALFSGEPYVPPYGDIHHRTETLSGISDPTLSLEWSPRADWMLGGGSMLPLGHTVPNPVILGREGLRHEHMQFGSGTFRPVLSAQFANARFYASAETHLSLYESNKGFRAPNELLWSTGPSFRAGSWSIDPRLQGQYQSLGHWAGEVDEGSGFNNGGVRLQVSLPFHGVVITPGIYRELFSHGASGQTFKQATTSSVSITR